MTYYKNAAITTLLNVYDIREKAFNEFEKTVENFLGKEEYDNRLKIDGYIEKIVIDNKVVTVDFFLPDGLLLDEYTTIEHARAFGDFFSEVGFANSTDYYSRYSTHANFLDKRNFKQLYKATRNFGKIIIDYNDDMTIAMIKELKSIQNLRYFENHEFIYIPDYYQFENMDIMGELPNFVHKPTGYAVRFIKGVGRSAHANKKISVQKLEKIFYDCKLSCLIEGK